MLGWLKNRRRAKIVSKPFPVEWVQILLRNTPFIHDYPSEHLPRLQGNIQILVAEKNWEGCGGLTVTDVHRVTIAAQIARLTFGLEHEYFESVRSILIYPDAYIAQSKNLIGSGVIVEDESGRLGEAWHRGPVILSWRDVLAGSRGLKNGHNVVLHEFAHQLDMRNGGDADGVPAIESASEAEQWLAVTSEAYAKLCERCRFGTEPVLDCYGTTNAAEFFAVATEAFFELPEQLLENWPALYQVLGRFYRQSPL